MVFARKLNHRKPKKRGLDPKKIDFFPLLTIGGLGPRKPAIQGGIPCRPRFLGFLAKLRFFFFFDDRVDRSSFDFFFFYFSRHRNFFSKNRIYDFIKKKRKKKKKKKNLP